MQISTSIAFDSSQALPAERRDTPRVGTALTARIRVRGDGRRICADVVDVSEEGCKLTTSALLAGETVSIAIAHLSAVPAKVCWVDGEQAGLQFQGKLHPAIVSHLGFL